MKTRLLIEAEDVHPSDRIWFRRTNDHTIRVADVLATRNNLAAVIYPTTRYNPHQFPSVTHDTSAWDLKHPHWIDLDSLEILDKEAIP